MKQRTLAIGLLGAAAMVIASGALGAGRKERLTLASYPSYPFSFRYPSAWSRLDCRQVPTSVALNVTFLTTVKPAPRCTSFGWPRQQLGRNGAFVDWWTFAEPGWSRIDKFPGHAARIGGEPARIEVASARASRSPSGSCAQVGGTRTIAVVIRRPRLPGPQWMMATACLRGPNVAAGESAVRRILASVSFARR